MYTNATARRPDAEDSLTEDFIDSWGIVGKTAVAITDPMALSPSLELLVGRLRAGYTWRCWEDEGRVRFVVIGIPGGRARVVFGGEVREGYFFDPSGRLASAGSWRRIAPGQWELLDRMEPRVAQMRLSRPDWNGLPPRLRVGSAEQRNWMPRISTLNRSEAAARGSA